MPIACASLAVLFFARLVGQNLGAGFRGSWAIRNFGTNSISAWTTHWQIMTIWHIKQKNENYNRDVHCKSLYMLFQAIWIAESRVAMCRREFTSSKLPLLRWQNVEHVRQWGDGIFHLWPAMESWASASAPPLEEPTPQVFQVAEDVEKDRLTMTRIDTIWIDMIICYIYNLVYIILYI